MIYYFPAQVSLQMSTLKYYDEYKIDKNITLINSFMISPLKHLSSLHYKLNAHIY